MFLILFALYIGLGIAYNMRENNLAGKEAIPNIEFWRNFPSLVQDGMAFTLEKTKNAVNTIKDKINGKNTDYNDL